MEKSDPLLNLFSAEDIKTLTGFYEDITNSILKIENRDKQREAFVGFMKHMFYQIVSRLREVQSAQKVSTEAIEAANEIKEKFSKLYPEILKVMEHSNKFKGKKITAKTEKMYHEIERVHNDLKKEYGETNYTMAVFKVAKKHKKNSKNLYANFMKWKNRLYVKSTHKG